MWGRCMGAPWERGERVRLGCSCQVGARVGSAEYGGREAVRPLPVRIQKKEESRQCFCPVYILPGVTVSPRSGCPVTS